MNELLRRLLFLPPQASTVARSVDHLHYFVILTTMAGATLITLVGGMFILKYRRRSHADPPRRLAAPNPPILLEATTVVVLLSLFVGWWLIGFMQYVRIRVPPEGSLDIYVTAKQWMWKFGYPDGHRALGALYIPAKTPIKLIMTSRDVIHSFYVPDFRIKQDVLPGRYTTAWFEVNEPGTYQILCAEFCGTNHSTMRGEVVALDATDYARWLAAGREDVELEGPHDAEPSVVGELGPSKSHSLVRIGEQVAAQQGCLRCHTLDGSDYVGPTWAGLYLATVPLERGGRVVADEAYLTESMMDPTAKLHAGYKAVMPSYFGRLQPAEVGALVELIKSVREVPGRPETPPALAPPPKLGEAAGAIGQPPQVGPLLPELQRVPSAPAQAPPSQQGLPPPGAQRVPEPEQRIRP